MATNIFNFNLLTNAQLNKYQSINDVTYALDSLLLYQVNPTPITVLPTTPVDGMLYLIAAGGVGVLAGNGGNVLYYSESGTVSNIAELPSGVVLGGYYTDTTDWKNDVLKDGVVTIVGSTSTIAVPNTPNQLYGIAVKPSVTLTLTSSLVLVGSSLVLTSGFYQVYVDGTNIYVK